MTPLALTIVAGADARAQRQAYVLLHHVDTEAAEARADAAS